ncbi:MAG: hypothetical protein IIA44_11235, partial [Acidobacteria bacterium]|nr:hypothetical protein [Acidobacteriota bacterium]
MTFVSGKNLGLEQPVLCVLYLSTLEIEIVTGTERMEIGTDDATCIDGGTGILFLGMSNYAGVWRWDRKTKGLEHIIPVNNPPDRDTAIVVEESPGYRSVHHQPLPGTRVYYRGFSYGELSGRLYAGRDVFEQGLLEPHHWSTEYVVFDSLGHDSLLLVEEWVAENRLAVSPDESKLAYVNKSGLWIYDLNTEVRSLPGTPEDFMLRDPVFSLDSQRLFASGRRPRGK